MTRLQVGPPPRRANADELPWTPAEEPGQTTEESRRPAAERRRSWPRLRLPLPGTRSSKHRSAAARDDEPASPLAQWTNGSSLKTKAATAVLVGALVLSPAGLVVGLAAASSGSPPTAPAEVADTRGEQAAVEEFATRFVTTWLSVTNDTAEDELAGLVEIPDAAQFPAEGMRASDPAIADVRQAGTGIWSVTVAVTAIPAGADQGVRRFFQVPIVYDDGRLAALALPAPVAAPTMADLPSLEYPSDLSPSDPAWQTVSGFMSALLAGKGDITRYLTPGTHVSPVSPAPYGAIRIDHLAAAVDLGVEPAREPADGEELAVLVTVTGLESRTSADGLSMQYALVLTGRDGRWEVTEVETSPHVDVEMGAGSGELPEGSPPAEEEQ